MGSIGYTLWQSPAGGRYKINYSIDLTTDEHVIRFTVMDQDKLIEESERDRKTFMFDISRTCQNYNLGEYILARTGSYILTIQLVVMDASVSRVRTKMIEDRKQQTLFGGRVVQKKKITRTTIEKVFQYEFMFKIREIPGNREVAGSWGGEPFHGQNLREFTNQLEKFCKALTERRMDELIEKL